MSNPYRDAFDQTADTVASEEMKHETTAQQLLTDPETVNRRAEPARKTTAPTINASYSQVLPRNFIRSWLRASLTAALVMGVVAGMPGSANAALPVSIGSAAPFGTLAGTAVVNTNLTSITGDLGVSPGSSVVGFPPGTVSGTVHATDATAAQAKADLVAAYNDVAGRTPDATVSPQLGGTTKTPGVYNSSNGTFAISGTLTLDAQGDPDAVFIFQASTLTTANVSNIALLRGAQANNLFWQVSGNATLGTYCTFRGNVLAQNSVTVNTGAAVFGRVFALNGTVSTQGTASVPATRITVPNDPPTTTTLTSSPNPAGVGEPITFIATVKANTGPVIPAGEVVFKDGSTIIGSSNHSSLGPATFTTSNLSPGDHQITAVYLGGDTFDHENVIHFAPSTSPKLTQSVSESLWDNTATPAVQSQPDSQNVVVGVKFRSAVDGIITGIRFYKGPQNIGTHIGSLWTSNGALLASATFTNETASGWQQVNFATPIPITANTTYVASYRTSGYYSVTRPYFTSQYTNGPLTALADGEEGGNGVFSYSTANTFPTNTYQATNYWVDVVFKPSTSLWDSTATPAVQSQSDSQDAAVGVKFRSAVDGVITGIRFYKGPQNIGTHIGSLWTSNGALLTSATFTNETASGWQKVNFATPIPITANTTYVASYYTTGRYSVTRPYFTSQYTNGPLTALADGEEGGNGVYSYSPVNTFPTITYKSTNYWVDVMFESN
ncbi:DUF4082 domain-containing protein [Streptosporangium sp. NPDC002544]|uniref:DUF4082 domain-containing protein n=1 Tax=Streptosporangium sp. NPDC002544 TaxID=3154538 RepID=UPI00332D8FC0